MFGIINGSGRQAFGLNIEGDTGTSAARGFPRFYDKFDGTWRASIALKKGYVGIGTTDPKQQLQIGDQIAFHNGGWKGLAFNGYYQDNNWKSLESGGIGTLMWDTNNYAFRFYTAPSVNKDGIAAPTEKLTILNDGNIGIGTAEPQSSLHLHVRSASTKISALTVDVQSFGNIQNAKASHFFRVRDIRADPPNGKTHFIICGDGNVGIGTTNPNATLDVNGNIAVNGMPILAIVGINVGGILKGNVTTNVVELSTAPPVLVYII